ncbi:MAG: DUF177 domain-containing protein [Nitrospirales bacterium]|nr:DUF177 domain-containing protein [Nitrospira sp.]MDR4500439.1 DUF177 domain-containing protein [Nitrospirales bacterium]
MMAKKHLAPTPNSLKFRVQDVPEDGFHLSCDVTQEDLELTADEGRILDALHVDCDVQKGTDGIGVKGTLSGTMIRQCVRCLSEYEDQIVLPCVGIFQDASIASEPNVDVNALDEELVDIGLEHLDDVYTYRDHHITLCEMLREQCILNTPIQKICQPECRGLCERCGINRNHASCTCDEVVQFSPMMTALRQFKETL